MSSYIFCARTRQDLRAQTDAGIQRSHQVEYGVYETTALMSLIRTYCYVSYCRKEDADEAVRRLHDYEVRPGYFLAVTKSVDNRKLVIKPNPALAPNVREEDVREELRQQLEGIVGVRFISSRWMEVEFESHKRAALARRIIVPGSLTIFQGTLITQVGKWRAMIFQVWQYSGFDLER